MPEMLQGGGPVVAAFDEPDSGGSGPPGAWLADFTPDGAAAGSVPIAYGGISSCPVPFIHGARGPLDPGWSALPDVVTDGLVELVPEEAAELRRLIAPPRLRPDGLPRFERLSGPRPEALREWNRATREPKLGARRRAVVLAVASDLAGLPLTPERDPATGPDGRPVDLSAARMVGLGDHVQLHRGVMSFKAKPDKAYKIRTRGRKILAAVGAWPWACVGDGKLPRGWHRWDAWRHDATFAEPLGRWVQASMVLR